MSVRAAIVAPKSPRPARSSAAVGRRAATPASARAASGSSSSRLRIRDARPSDEKALVRSTLGNALESEGLRLDEKTVRRAVRRLLADPHKGRIFVAEESGRVHGTTYVTFEWSDWHDAWYWWVQSVYVVPNRRGTGVYTALYDAIHTAARKAGDVRAIRLYVEKANDHGLRAYRGHGMKELEYLVFEGVVRKGAQPQRGS